MAHFLPWPYPRALAHRGGGTLAPENTLAGIRCGIAHGFRAVEFDAMLAADAVPVLIHDETLDRTTDGRGRVAEHTAAQLAVLDAGGWRAARFAGEPVPTLAQAAALCRAAGVWMNVEIKPARGHDAATGEVVAKAVAALFADRLAAVAEGRDRADLPVFPPDAEVPLLSSFSPVALAAARVAAPRLPRGLLVDRVGADWRERLVALGAVALHTNHRHLTAAQARAVKAAGYWLFCYTVDEPARVAELLGWGVDAFCTDRVDRIDPSGPAPLASGLR